MKWPSTAELRRARNWTLQQDRFPSGSHLRPPPTRATLPSPDSGWSRRLIEMRAAGRHHQRCRHSGFWHAHFGTPDSTLPVAG
jgi:hypothetical protein